MGANPLAETHLLARSRVYSFRRFRIQVTDGPERGTEKVSDATEFGIGSAPGNQLQLTDPTVSRHHCLITASPQGFLLRDLGSKNGTTLAGFRVESAYLHSGAVIGLGLTTLRFDPLEDEIREPLSEDERFGRALGKSAGMRRIFALLPRIAASDSTVLLEGETGSGKTLLADAIHQAGPRARNPFVVVDCGSIPPTLIESELFGHEKGAFTGAHAARAGAFQAAQGGTVFLDEVAEMPLEMQPKLLRALEDRVIKRIGSVDPIRLDVRVIAATNRDLRQEVNRGSFRSDLFYRLNIVRLRIPPLRERREDIPLLVTHFYGQFVSDGDPNPPAELIASLSRQDWPGNVRELRSAVERSVLMGDPQLWREIVDPPLAPAGAAPVPGAADFDPTVSFRAAKERAVASWERSYIGELVRRSGGNLSQAARMAHMDRNHLRELVRRHGIPVREE
ncbi:MAG TPA: sigma 54-interacting transcriptional regulator [Polyangia bacterium]|nr:sigma 54-interacting transcriptional regulator [Polyangia bacterium]